MIPMHLWLPSVRYTQESMCTVSSVYKHHTGGARQAVGHEVPRRQVNARMCNVLETPEIGAGELINESPTRLTTHSGPKVP